MASHTLWHTFERTADDIGVPHGLAFVEHGSNEARILLAQSVWYSKDESATSSRGRGERAPEPSEKKQTVI